MSESNDVRMTLNYTLDTSIEKYADLPAICMATETPLTYREFGDRIYALAANLASEGVKKGDHIALLGENSPNWGVAYLAIVRLGAIAVPILPDLPEADVHHILNEMHVPVLFVTNRQIEKIYELNQKELKRIITLDDSAATQDVLDVTHFSTYLEESFVVKETMAKIGRASGRERVTSPV